MEPPRFAKSYRYFFLALVMLITRPIGAAVVTIDESFSSRLMGLDFEFFEDETGQLDFETVRYKEFKPNPYRVPAFGYAKSTYWYRFSLRNATNLEHRLYLELDVAWIDHFSIFMQESDQWVRRDAGVAYPVNDRSVKSSLPTHRIELPAQSEKLIYVRISSSDTLVLPIYLHTAADFASHIRIKELLYGLFAGIMVVAAFYGFIFYLYTFNRAYLYYCLNTLSWLVMFAVWDGYGQEYLVHDNYEWNKRLNVLVMCSSMIWGALFTLKILEVPAYSRLMTRVILGWVGVQLTIVVATLVLPYHVMMQVAALVALGFPVMLGATGLVALRHKLSIARYYLLSWIFPIIGVTVFNGLVVGFVVGSPFSVYALHFGVLCQSLFLSFTLSYHLREATRNASVLKVSVEAAGLAHSALMKNELDPQHFELSYRYRPCDESGGDVFSCLQDPRGSYSYVVVGDVSGHGITAAIISSAFTGALNAAVKGLNSLDLNLEESCKKIMNDVNQVMCDYFSRTNHFASAVLVGIDSRDGQTVYINAGHRNIFLKTGEKVSVLLRGGSLMGLHPGSHLMPVHLTLLENDMLLLFTDGLVENNFGGSEKRRIDLLINSLKKSSQTQEVIDSIWQAIGSRKRPANFADDMTLLVIKLTSLQQASSQKNQAGA